MVHSAGQWWEGTGHNPHVRCGLGEENHNDGARVKSTHNLHTLSAGEAAVSD